MVKIRLLNTGDKAIVDDKDLKKVEGHKWHYDGKRVKGSNIDPKTGKRRQVFMHDIILNNKKGAVTHLNGDGLDCRKENLKVEKGKKAPAKKTAAPKKTASKGKKK